MDGIDAGEHHDAAPRRKRASVSERLRAAHGQVAAARGIVPVAVTKWLAFAFACAAWIAIATGARADGASLEDAAQSSDPMVAADALYRLAEAEDAAGAYAYAIQHYRASVDRLPSFRYAPKAMTRAAVLQAHSEGDFRPYARLESVRRDPKASDDAASIDALARDADTFPPGPTRSEAWMVCADAYLSRLQRRADGEAALRRVTGDPKADALLQRQAASTLLNALLDDGDLEAARETSQTMAKLLDARMIRRVAVAARRRWLHHASIAELALFSILAAIAVARAAARGAWSDVRRALRGGTGFALAFAVYVALAGGALASAYETGNAAPFLIFGAALAPIVVAARAWGAAGSSAGWARAARAVVCASAVVAAAFLVLEAVNVQYLEGFKL